MRLRGSLHANAVRFLASFCVSPPSHHQRVLPPTTDKLRRGRDAGPTANFVLGSFLYKNVTGIYCLLLPLIIIELKNGKDKRDCMEKKSRKEKWVF